MGLAQCNKHAETGVVGSISIDICGAVRANTKISPNIIHVIKIAVYDEEEFLFEDKMYVSGDIFDRSGLKYNYVIRTEQDEERLNLILPETSGLCAGCFKDYIGEFDAVISQL